MPNHHCRVMRKLLLFGAVVLALPGLGGCASTPRVPLTDDNPALFIPEAGREAPRLVSGITAQRVGVIPAEAGQTRADGILRLTDGAGDFADVFVYGAGYEIKTVGIDGARAYQVESWGDVDGRPHGALSYAFPNGVVIDVYDGPDPEIRHIGKHGGMLELYWASEGMETPGRVLVGRNRARELILNKGDGDDVYRDWSRLETASVRYLGGQREGDDWYLLRFAGADGKVFQLPMPGSRRILLSLLAALKDQPVMIVHGYGRLDVKNRLYKGPLLYGASALPPRAAPEPGPDSAGEDDDVASPQ